MTPEQIAGGLLIAGSTGFGLGAAIGVPRVFTAPDAEGRLRMLELHRGLWRTAQPLYGAARSSPRSPSATSRPVLPTAGAEPRFGVRAWRC